jgi:hypothetical protein
MKKQVFMMQRLPENSLTLSERRNQMIPKDNM